MSNSKAVVLLSGGLDSSTLLWYAIAQEVEVVALSVLYGQRHEAELRAAAKVAARAHVMHVACPAGYALAPIFAAARSSQVGTHAPVPEGHYAADNMAVTVVPNRNMILLSIAGAFSVAQGAGRIAYAAHAGDHPQYPDCRPEFIEAFRKALFLATEVSLWAPFAHWTKADIVREGAKLGVPFDLTYSCYAGRDKHCGRCGTCVERAEAFDLARVPDPTKYEDPTFWKTAVLEHKKGQR
jgi:7-cyano-7-deazaguanine synthase